MILRINTTKLEKIEFALLDSKKVVAEYSTTLEYHENGDILKHLDTFLRKEGVNPLPPRGQVKHKKKPTTDNLQLTTISVSAGQGSYTGIRVGTSIAQALSLAWNIPIKMRGV